MLLSAVIKFFIKGHEHLCPCITLSKIKINTAGLLLAHAHSSAHVTQKAATPLINGAGGGNQIYQVMVCLLTDYLHPVSSISVHT